MLNLSANMKVVKNNTNVISQIVKVLKNGGLAIMPTETTYRVLINTTNKINVYFNPNSMAAFT